MNPLVSIIIPTYNREHLIGETLQSVLDQTYQNWECIVVDDLSTDNTDEVLKSWTEKDNRFKYFKRHREPKGAPTCRNIGLEKAGGEYVIFLDSDDLLADFCLERRVKAFAVKQSCDFLVFQTVMIEPEKRSLKAYWNIENEQTDLERFLRTEALWQTSGPIYQRHFAKQKCYFKEGQPFWQDTELGMRILLDNPVYFKFLKSKPDVFISMEPNSISRKLGLVDSIEILTNRENILLEISNLIKKSCFVLSVSEKKTFWSVNYFLIKHFLVRFNNPKMYLKYLLQIRKNLDVNWWRFVIAFWYQYLFYWRKYSIYIIKVRSVYERIFHKVLPDVNELENILLHKIPVEEKDYVIE